MYTLSMFVSVATCDSSSVMCYYIGKFGGERWGCSTQKTTTFYSLCEAQNSITRQVGLGLGYHYETFYQLDPVFEMADV